MFQRLVVASLLLLSFAVSASDNKVSAGFGFQYGGVLGVKYAIDSDNSRYFASIGALGGSVGYEYALSDTNAITLALGSEVLVSEKGFIMLEFNHYFQGRDNDGWRFGAGAGVVREDQGGFYANLGKTDTTGTISVNLGYQF